MPFITPVTGALHYSNARHGIFLESDETQHVLFLFLRLTTEIKRPLLPPGWISKWFLGLPGGTVGLRHCIEVLAVPPETLGLSPGSVAAGRNREVHGATHNRPGVVRVREGLAGRDIIVSSCTSYSFGGRAQCTLIRSLGARCFL